ncbi:MAG: HAD-IIIA family hydrolase [Longimicrobiales bacterium]|nr:HAD-IIIA family hydrolase [Longimicrobiales bacterium]
MTPNGLRAVLLDAGNTLLFADPERVLSTLREEGVEADVERFRRAEYRARLNLVEFVREGHRGTEDHVWERYFLTLFRECGVPEDRMEPVGARLQAIHREEHLWTHVEEGTTSALNRIAEAGYRLAVISNADGRVEALMESVGLRHHFEFVLDSGTVGVEKPDPAIFHMAVDHLALEPEECLYVGDLFPVDVVGARRAGLQALLVDPFGRMAGEVDRIASVCELPDYLEAT